MARTATDSYPPLQGHGRLLGGLVLAAALFTLLLPGSSEASRSQKTFFDATVDLYAAPSREVRAKRVSELGRMGVDVVRIYVNWEWFAPRPDARRMPAGFDPTNPRDYPHAYAGLDDTIEGIQDQGMDVILTPTGPFPKWASRSRESNLKFPRPDAYRDWLYALGRRYSGSFRDGGRELPAVGRWALWNEPNLHTFLQPQFRNGRPFSPRLYRRLFLAGQAGLRASGNGGDQILIGETATSSGPAGINPIPFLRQFMCLNQRFEPVGDCDPVAADGWSHHPYGYSFPPHTVPRNPGMISMRTIGRLMHALDRVARAGAVERRLDLFITEYGILSEPKSFGVSLNQQAGYLAISEYLAWRQPRIRAYGQYLLHDDPLEYESAFTTGLRLAGGRKKPAYRAFLVTLLPKREGRRGVLLWGHVRPAGGRTTVEVRMKDPGKRPRLLRRIRTDRFGYFHFRNRYRDGRRWFVRARLPDGRRVQGPRLKAYKVP